jgi:uncharacterized RDD family membrane protein YckC/cytoskeletal protein CcmA (bactofilin family)
MKHPFKALIAGSLLAALVPFAPAALAADAGKPQNDAAPATQPALHEIGDSVSSDTPAPSPVPAARHDQDYGQANRVNIGSDTYVGADETIEGNAVAVLGSLTVDGTVNGNAVGVLGSATINGTVHGNAVAVLGTLTLGPKARVDGNVVAGAGKLVREPGSSVGGNIVEQGPSGLSLSTSGDSEMASWFNHGLRMGRPLAFAPHLHKVWFLNICLLAFYVLLAVVFPNGVRKCGETLAQRPGITMLTGFLTLIGLPVLFIILCVTVVGIPVALVVLPLGILASVLFGKAAVYSFVGRSVLGREVHPALSLLLGVLVLMAIYFIPFIGLAVWVLVAFVGFACALTTVFAASKSSPIAVASAAPPVAPAPPDPPAAPVAPTAPAALVAPAAAAAVTAPPEAIPAAPQPPPVSPVPPLAPATVAHVSESALPRAGFWIRMVALLVDLILVAIVFHFVPVLFMVALATYAAVLWKLRGATIGGIIFGIKIVRLDGRPSDWVTMIVRALACFLSLVVVGLGFFWIAFDPEKQGWHDKIAGTVAVRLPKGVSLV